MTRRRTLMDDVLDEMAAHAASGEPMPGRWVCGLCMREEGVRQFVVRVADTAGGFAYRLVCPCCSLAGCEHRAVTVPA